MTNSVEFIANNTNCSSFLFQTDNGRITQTECRLFYIPERSGYTSIKVFRKHNSNLRLVDSIEIMVYQNLIAEAWLGSKSGGVIQKSELLAIGGIICTIRTREDHSERISIQGYTVIVHKADGRVEYSVNGDGKFNEVTKDIIEQLENGEKVTFTNFRVRGNSENEKYIVNPIEFVVK